jgi:hypothetical protein
MVSGYQVPTKPLNYKSPPDIRIRQGHVVAPETARRYWLADRSHRLDVVANRPGRWKRKYAVQGKGELLYGDAVLE